MDMQFKKRVPRKKEPVRNVTLSAEAKKAYEDLLKQKEERERDYARHLGTPEYKGR
ncbi:hypothetical protein [Phreatobacter stygius]|uniref:hypothetical protein n=1 Tax=Phreatobacter stygius TaxID=1940610 RepID=UPI0014777AC8|nr:hypothetical protein [Phreatobacter stygius]